MRARTQEGEGVGSPTGNFTGNLAVGATAATPFGSKCEITQGAIGTPVLLLQSTATNDDPRQYTVQGRIAVTNATATTLITLATVSNNSYFVEVEVLARRTGGAAGAASDSAGYKLIGTFRNNAGTLTQVGATTVVSSHEDQAAWNATLGVSGTSIIVQFSGALNNDVTAHGTMRYMLLST